MSEEIGGSASQAFARVREVAGYLGAAQERIATLEAGIGAMRDSTRRDLQLAQDRVDEAERRYRESEARLAELVSLITQEFPAGLSFDPSPVSAEVRHLQPNQERPTDRFDGLRRMVDDASRPELLGDRRSSTTVAFLS